MPGNSQLCCWHACATALNRAIGTELEINSRDLNLNFSYFQRVQRKKKENVAIVVVVSFQNSTLNNPLNLHRNRDKLKFIIGASIRGTIKKKKKKAIVRHLRDDSSSRCTCDRPLNNLYFINQMRAMHSTWNKKKKKEKIPANIPLSLRPELLPFLSYSRDIFLSFSLFFFFLFRHSTSETFKFLASFDLKKKYSKHYII